jgi:hypothetical protein
MRIGGSDQGAVSLMTVLCLVGIVMLLASAMVGVFTINLNTTQRSFNGTVAESEAEAGIAEVLYRITLEDNIDNSKQPPTVSFGRSEETIRGTVTPGVSPDEAYHVVTFAQGTGFPHSTNNTYLDRDTGFAGRTVPDGMLHIISTGYSQGQVRTIEALISKPPFPFGLATSGELVSRDPFVVKGVTSLANLIEGNEDRPGHILCNSPEGVVIGQSDPPRETYISGFVKSAGPIAIAQPARVLGGLRPNSDVSTLASIDVTRFRNEGEPGVVTINDPVFVKDQTMDIMYFFSGDQLTYERSVHLKQALLYVEGDLLIRGPVTGEGLIVVDGNVTFGSGTTLDGANKMAVLASGDVTIRGASNYFTGLIYCGGNFTASNVTVVGNTIVNSPDPAKGRAELENVTVVSNTETADMTITITSSSSALGQDNADDGVIPLMLNNDTFGLPDDWDYSNNGGGKLKGWISPDEDREMYVEALMKLYERALIINNSDGGFPKLGHGPGGGSAGAVWEQAQKLYQRAAKNRAINVKLAEKKKELEAAAKAKLPTGDIQAAIAELEAELVSKEDFRKLAEELVKAVFEHKKRHADGTGVFDDGTATMDISLEHRFNLNEYLPESERIKVAFWRVYNHRL